MRDINVCFDGGFFSQSGKGAIQAVLRGQRSWANSADINFVGWQDCTTNSWGVRIEAADLLPPPIPPLSFVLALGPEPSGVSRMTLRFDTEDCDFLQSGVECAGDVGLHEFGHSLGLAHEQLRPGGLCVVGFGGPGDDVIGAYNGASIMEQCGQPSELSQMDRVGIGYLYGARYVLRRPQRTRPRRRFQWRSLGRSPVSRHRVWETSDSPCRRAKREHLSGG